MAPERQPQLALGLYVAILFFAILSRLFFSTENGKLQAEFDTKFQKLQQLREHTVGAINGASKTAANEIVAEISAPTETIAASDLQKRLLEVAAGSTVTVHSIQAQVSAESSPQQLRRITAELTFDGRIESLQQFLFEVETNVPFIFVDTVSVQPLPTYARKESEDIMLRVTLTASSYWKSHQLNDKG
ncbi:MAG: type II secretion system protein GspM [Rhodomicrobium sp.]